MRSNENLGDQFKVDLDDIVKIGNSETKAVIYADKSAAAKINRRLQPYKQLPRTFRPVLEAWGDYVRVKMIPQVFEREGPGWRPLSRRTIAERIQAGWGGAHPILQRSGDLLEELTDRSHPRHIEVIKTGKNARIEIGGSSQKFIENQLGVQERRLPRRPMIPGTGNMPLADRDRIAMKTIAERVIRQKRDQIDTVS